MDSTTTTPNPSSEVSESTVKNDKKKITLSHRIHTWPYLVRMEFLTAIIVMLGMTVWAIGMDAPTEQPADPNRTPNPSKAPWYFLGLQEILVYFDPWYAGVVLPTLIIVGLMAIPYIDINPRGNGYYTFRERKFAISVFLFGFVVLWLSLIVLGTFFRGPGWNIFLPWEYWDPHKVVALTSVDLPYMLGARQESTMFIVGMLLVFCYYPGGALVGQLLLRDTNIYKQLGAVRYHITAGLFLMMFALVIKIFLRLAFNVKYIWVTPWFNV